MAGILQSVILETIKGNENQDKEWEFQERSCKEYGNIDPAKEQEMI